LKEMEKIGSARFFYDYDYYMRYLSAQGVEPIFETDSFSGSSDFSVGIFIGPDKLRA